MNNKRKGISIILSIFLLVILFSFVSLSAYRHVADTRLQQQFESSLQIMYEMEAAKTACLWEEAHTPFYYNWDTDVGDTTYESVPRLANSSIDPADGFYRLAGYNFLSKVYNEVGEIKMYVHSFRGTEADPQSSRYLEYIFSPSPMYRYAIFSNRSLEFRGESLYECAGGRIHTNGDLVFRPQNDGLRFSQVGELTASGTIMYRLNRQMPAPFTIDSWDGNWDDGMAPAPPINGDHSYVTTEDVSLPGPFMYYYVDSDGIRYRWWKWYGDMVGGGWGSDGNPRLWEGEEYYFYGNQYDPSPSDEYMDKYGHVTSGMPSAGQEAIVKRIYYDMLSGTLQLFDFGSEYADDDVQIQPYQDKLGNLNEVWYEIPGALAEEYPWANKYGDTWYDSQSAVTFYATELCAAGSTGCQTDSEADDPNTGWRYLKRDVSGNPCADEACYNDPNSNFVKAQDYNNYFDNINPPYWNTNSEFFNDYAYGNDEDDPNSPERQIRAFNSLSQPSGFQEYLNMLSSQGIEGVINSGVDEKEPYLGDVFDTGSSDSPYKLQAMGGGIYIDSSNVDSVISDLNSGCATPVAEKVTFYNWETSQEVTLIDIDVGELKNKTEGADACSMNFNGVVYTKYPIRLSNAENLPGQNSGGKKAVFTVVSEQSVYLKGNYNTGAADPENWKISHLASKKKIYTLSNAFNDPATPPDFAIYNEYPYVYMKVERDPVTGYITNYLPQEGDPALGDGIWAHRDWWYDGMDPAVDQWKRTTVDAKQKAYVESGITPPNRVDQAEYSYYSLFITPYDGNWGDDSLENWYYIDPVTGQERRATKNMVGAFLDFYDPSDPDYNDEYYTPLGPEEVDSNGDWDYRRTSPYYPDNRSEIRDYAARYNLNNYRGDQQWPLANKKYDSRFPQVTPKTNEGLLGFTGWEIWRPIPESYYDCIIANNGICPSS